MGNYVFKILRGNANQNKSNCFSGVGGRGLCVGEAENRAGKAALSRLKEAGQNAKRSEVFGRLIEGEARAVASGERVLQAGGAKRSGTPLAAAVYGRAGTIFFAVK